jgi:hypothetical protein
MSRTGLHTFHIPVLGLGYSIDTPVKVARFGISSVISIIEDELIEQMRAYHCRQQRQEYIPISKEEDDHRSRRITAYLDLVNLIVGTQVKQLRQLPFSPGTEIIKYFELLPENSPAKHLYNEMMALEDGAQKLALQAELRDKIEPGAIDVNIMAKVDNINYNKKGEALPVEFSDALSAFRGFANSSLNSSVVFSAGYNPRLYSYAEQFNDFFPDDNGNLKKRIILKVSDYRSALIQGKILAKKGLWISEFRIESGLNCGGHAFATDGLLLGPILEEFKDKRHELEQELFELSNTANAAKNKNPFLSLPELKITVQGGIGTANENDFLLNHYKVDSTGWGSPFLLVPEATNVDTNTLEQLATAEKDDYYLSYASPLGVPFNNFRKSTSEKQRLTRIEKGRPGSPCYKKFLSSDTEFTEVPICTASRQYQHLKIKQLKEKNLPADIFETALSSVTEKDCLCEGLTTSVLLKDNIDIPHKLEAVTICPGPNLAYFSGVFSLKEMVNHIYGRVNILNSIPRPNMFINELKLYVDYLKNCIEKKLKTEDVKQLRYFQTFKENLLLGVSYYKDLVPSIKKETEKYMQAMREELNNLESILLALPVTIVKTH